MNDRTGRLDIEAEEAQPALQQRAVAGNLRGLGKLWPYIRPYKLSVVLAFIGLVIAAGATLSLPVAVRRMIDLGFSGDNAGLINSYFAMLLVIAAILAGASAMRFYFVSWIGERVVSDIRTSVFAHLTTLSPAFYERTHSAELMSRLTADTTQIKAAVSSAVSQLLRNAFLLVGALSMMVLTSATLSALVIGVIPLIVLPLVAYGRAVRRLSRQAQDELANASTYAAENLGSPTTMQAFTVEPHIISRYSHAVEITFEAARKRIVARAGLTATVTLLVFASIVGILWYGAREVLTGGMTGGTLAQFVLYAAFAAGSVAVLSEIWGEIQQAVGAAGRLDELLAVKPDIVPPENPVPMPVPPRGEIAFREVGFSYPGKPEAPVFHALSFTVRPGERIAIVGPSGAGKTTIFNLLLRFYDPQSGQVLIDGVSGRDAAPTDWRSRISYVPQDPIIFAASIAENIAYGSPEAGSDQIQQAARMALADEFIEALPQGYDTILGERGITLSGGQRQRIAIARALLRDTPILLLDEATSALDAESEGLVQKALGRVMQDRTTLVIAHRLATVLNADRILVIDRGEIAEEGTHAVLVAHGGIYARLAELQFRQEAGAA